MTTLTTGPVTTSFKPIANYDRPLWQRMFMTREMAIIALFLAVVVVAAGIFTLIRTRQKERAGA